MVKRAKRKNSYINITEYIDLEKKTPSQIVSQIKDFLKEDVNILEIYNIKAKAEKSDTNEANLELFALSENLCCLVGIFTTVVTREEAIWILDGEDPELGTRELFFAVKGVPKEFVKEEKIKKKKQDGFIDKTRPAKTMQDIDENQTTVVSDSSNSSCSSEASIDSSGDSASSV